MHSLPSIVRRCVVLLTVVLLAACGGVAPSAAPTTGPLGTTTAPGTGTHAPASSSGPNGASGLPAPTLTHPTEIGAALWDPARVEAGVVSIVEQLGIDIFTADGKLLRDAGPDGPPGMWLFESEVRGLIEMGKADAAAIAGHGAPFTLVDLYKGLADVYPGLSQDQLLDAYIQAYKAAPGDLVRESFAGHAFVPEAGFTRVHLWLFVLDGVLGRPQPATATTVAYTGSQTARGPVARVVLPPPSQGLAQLMALDLTALPIALAHMATLAYTLPVDFTISPSTVHEGHFGSGQPAALEIRSQFVPAPIVSPYTGLPLLLPYRTGLEGLPVTFESPHEAFLNAHGSLSGTLGIPVFTDALGEARLDYTPRREAADGDGDLTTDVAIVNAVIEMRQIVLYMYNAGGAANLATGARIIPQPLVIEWHEDTSTQHPLLPGTYTATLTGPAPGTGASSGGGTILCTVRTVGGVQYWSASSGLLSGGLSEILMIQSEDGRSSIYVTPAGLGIEAQWGALGPAAATQRINITGQLGDPSVVTGITDYTYGVNPPIPFSVTVSVTCSDTIT